MTVEVDTSGDFAHILDAGQSLILQRRDTAEEIAIATARRFAAITTEAEPSSGYAMQQNIVWQFPWSDAGNPPLVGDTLTDGTGRSWTILQVDQLGGNTRWRCHARDLRLASDLDTTVDIQQAVWDDLGSGPEIVDWETVHSAVAARIQPDVTIVDREVEPPTSAARYRVILGEQIPLDHNHRLVDVDQTVYELVEYIQAERIDRLPVAIAVAVSSI